MKYGLMVALVAALVALGAARVGVELKRTFCTVTAAFASETIVCDLGEAR